MHLATTTPYPEHSSPTLVTTVSLGIYTFTFFASALIIFYIHHCSIASSPSPCPTSQPLPFPYAPTWLSAHPDCSPLDIWGLHPLPSFPPNLSLPHSSRTTALPWTNHQLPLPHSLGTLNLLTSHFPYTLPGSWSRIQVTEGQWIISSASQVLVHNSMPSTASTHCYICSNLSHHGTECSLYTCPTCCQMAPGHTAHHCLATQCNLCHQWGHSDDICNLWICGRCDEWGHVVDNCPINPLSQSEAQYTYAGSYLEDDDLNTLVDDDWEVKVCWAWGLNV